MVPAFVGLGTGLFSDREDLEQTFRIAKRYSPPLYEEMKT
jgi:hypothetical protein